MITEKRRHFNTHVTSYIAVRIPKSIFIMKTGQDKLFTARKRSLGQGNIFAPVCHSVITVGEGGLPQCIAGICCPPPREQTPHPGSRHSLEQTPPWSRHPPMQCMLGDTVNKRAVRILLKCNLFRHSFHIKILEV